MSANTMHSLFSLSTVGRMLMLAIAKRTRSTPAAYGGTHVAHAEPAHAGPQPPARGQHAWRATGRCCSLMGSVWLRSQWADSASWGKLSCAGAGEAAAAPLNTSSSGELLPCGEKDPERAGTQPSQSCTFALVTAPQGQV